MTTPDQKLKHLMAEVNQIANPNIVLLDFKMILSRLKMLASLGKLSKESVKEVEDAYFEVRGQLMPGRLPKGHMLHDPVRDKPWELGDIVEFCHKGKTKKGRLVYCGRPFTRYEVTPKQDWSSGAERALFLKICQQHRKRVMSPLRKVCRSGNLLKVKTRLKSTGEVVAVYYDSPMKDWLS